jgi:hypothetical protein
VTAAGLAHGRRESRVTDELENVLGHCLDVALIDQESTLSFNNRVNDTAMFRRYHRQTA